MKFKGSTVAAFVLLTMTASIFVTLTVADRWLLDRVGAHAGIAAMVSEQASGLSDKEVKKLNTVMSLIETRYYKEIDREALIDGALNGMIGVLGDPYSSYMQGEDAEHFSESVEGSFSGIGAEVRMEQGQVVIVAPIRDSPAEKAGLLPLDILLSVNGEELQGLPLNEAVAKIRGTKGTKAKLLIQRAGVVEPIRLTVTRGDIAVETVYAQMLPGDIGKIEIRQFAMRTGERFKEELARLEAQGMKALVVDVRNNPGGVLPVVVDVAEALVPAGETIVQVEERDGKLEKTLSSSEHSGKPYPVAVLINKGSASASEVLAGALSESANATLVGEASFGKGTVQVSYNKAIGDGSLVKLTIAKWLTPNGNWVNEHGLLPHVEVLPPAYYSAPRLTRTETLKPDMLGNDIRSMQLMLEGLGYTVDRKDGYYSDQTAAAVAQFQQAHRLPASGEADLRTMELLEEKLVEAIQDPANDVQLNSALEILHRKLEQRKLSAAG